MYYFIKYKEDIPKFGILESRAIIRKDTWDSLFLKEFDLVEMLDKTRLGTRVIGKGDSWVIEEVSEEFVDKLIDLCALRKEKGIVFVSGWNIYDFTIKRVGLLKNV